MSFASQPKPRDHIEALAPYQLADMSPTGNEKPIILSQNEHGSPPSGAVIRAAAAAARDANRYPEDDAATLRNAIAAAETLAADQIICANGSMELISLIAQCYLRPGDEAVISAYGYLFFRTVVEATGAIPVLAPEKGLRTDIEAMLRAVSSKTRVMFLANPNNPTGSLLSGDEIRHLRSVLRDDILLILDGAYAEYVAEPGYDPGVELVSSTSNTVMIRTFSKIYGLAGLRIGWGYFPSAVAGILNRVRLPNTLGSPAVAAASVAIAQRARLRRLKLENLSRRSWFENELSRLGLVPEASHGNFSLVSFNSAKEASRTDTLLRRRNIFVRPMLGYGLAKCLRITIGRKEELSKLLEVLS